MQGIAGSIAALLAVVVVVCGGVTVTAAVVAAAVLVVVRRRFRLRSAQEGSLCVSRTTGMDFLRSSYFLTSTHLYRPSRCCSPYNLCGEHRRRENLGRSRCRVIAQPEKMKVQFPEFVPRQKSMPTPFEPKFVRAEGSRDTSSSSSSPN